MPVWISGDCGGANACSSAALQAYTLLLATGYLTVINTVDTPVLLHAAQAFLITADTVVDGILPAFPHLFHPIRICDELAAHGGAVDPVLLKLFFDKRRMDQAAHAAEGECGQPAQRITEIQEAAFLAEKRMAGRRNGVGKSAVVGQRNMEAGYACLFQERHEYGKLLLQDAGVSVMRVFPAHGQFKIYGKLGECAADGGNAFHCKARPVFR